MNDDSSEVGGTETSQETSKTTSGSLETGETLLSSSLDVEPSNRREASIASEAFGLAVPTDGRSQANNTPAPNDDDSQEDTGKNPGVPVLRPETDRRTGTSVNSIPHVANSELTKSAPTGDLTQMDKNPALNALVVPTGGNIPPHVGAKIQIGEPPSNEESSSSSVGVSSGPTLQNSTGLVTKIEKSDVRITLLAEQYGPVELHAKMTGDQVTASITVEHRESHASLSSDLPVLHQLLNERNLRVSEIAVVHESVSSDSSSDEGSQAKGQETSPQQTGGSVETGGEGSALAAGVADEHMGATTIFDSRGRLNVRA